MSFFFTWTISEGFSTRPKRPKTHRKGKPKGEGRERRKIDSEKEKCRNVSKMLKIGQICVGVFLKIHSDIYSILFNQKGPEREKN